MAKLNSLLEKNGIKELSSFSKTKDLEWQPFLGLFFGRHLCLVFYGG
ncbi:hypothetical protein SAP269_20940 [Spiroplasma ixodetis]|uniref:Uncharacterized protein n=1 Tax=Spiroplasma ixodetis TaxID=2141 RepID=A0ABM8JQA3_9MOLU